MRCRRGPLRLAAARELGLLAVPRMQRFEGKGNTANGGHSGYALKMPPRRVGGQRHGDCFIPLVAKKEEQTSRNREIRTMECRQPSLRLGRMRVRKVCSKSLLRQSGTQRQRPCRRGHRIFDRGNPPALATLICRKWRTFPMRIA